MPVISRTVIAKTLTLDSPSLKFRRMAYLLYSTVQQHVCKQNIECDFFFFILMPIDLQFEKQVSIENPNRKQLPSHLR